MDPEKSVSNSCKRCFIRASHVVAQPECRVTKRPLASPLLGMYGWRITRLVLLFFVKPSVLNSRRYEIIENYASKTTGVYSIGGESAVEGDRISPLKGNGQALEQKQSPWCAVTSVIRLPLYSIAGSKPMHRKKTH